MKKDINIGGKIVTMSASALTPFLYKQAFGEDLIKGMQILQTTTQEGTMDSVFVSKMAWIMAKEADKEIPPIEEWLSQFEMFAIFEAFPSIIELWALNEKSNSIPRKK